MSSPLTLAIRASALDVRIEIDRNLPGEIADAVVALTATYEPSSAPVARRYELRASPLSLLRDGVECRPPAAPSDLLLQLELELLHDVSEAMPPGWFLHAAAVERGERAIVLVGPSGAGKSTTTCGLVARGAGYVSDELVLIGDEGVSGLARPIAFDGPFVGALPEGFASFERVAPWMERPSPVIHPPPTSIVRRPLPLAAVVVLRHAPTETPCIAPITSAEALPACWAETRRQDQDGLRRAIEVLSEVPTYSLVTRTLDDACTAVESIG